MIDGSEKRNRQLAFELQNSHVCEKRSKSPGGQDDRNMDVYHQVKQLSSCRLHSNYKR